MPDWNGVRFDVHRIVEGTMGLALVICPVLFGFAPGSPVYMPVEAVVVAGALGLALASLGLVAGSEGRAMPISLHRAMDAVIAAALVITCIVLSFRGATGATLLLAVIAFPYALLVIGTRYEPQELQAEATTVAEEDSRL